MNVDDPEDAHQRDLLARTRQQEFLAGPSPRPVDKEQIRALHAGELPRELELEVRDLTVAFRDWSEASRDVLLERLALLPAEDLPDTNAIREMLPPSRPQRNRRTWIALATAVALLVCIALAIWYPRNGNQIAELDVRVLSRPTRGTGPFTPLSQNGDDTFRISGRDFYLQIASSSSGYVSIVLQSPEGTRSYPPSGRPLLLTASSEGFEYGPLLKPRGFVVVAVIVTSREAASDIATFVRVRSPQDVNSMRATLNEYFSLHSHSYARFSVFRIEGDRRS